MFVYKSTYEALKEKYAKQHEYKEATSRYIAQLEKEIQELKQRSTEATKRSLLNSYQTLVHNIEEALDDFYESKKNDSETPN